MINTPPNSIDTFTSLDERTSPTNLQPGMHSTVESMFYRKGKGQRIYGKTITLKTFGQIISLGVMGRNIIIHEDSRLVVLTQSTSFQDSNLVVDNEGNLVFSNLGEQVYGNNP